MAIAFNWEWAALFFAFTARRLLSQAQDLHWSNVKELAGKRRLSQHHW
jgi:hypothetical protein